MFFTDTFTVIVLAMLLLMAVLVMLSVFVRRQCRRQQRSTVDLELVTFTSSTEVPTPSLPLPPLPAILSTQMTTSVHWSLRHHPVHHMNLLQDEQDLPVEHRPCKKLY